MNSFSLQRVASMQYNSAGQGKSFSPHPSTPYRTLYFTYLRQLIFHRKHSSNVDFYKGADQGYIQAKLWIEKTNGLVDIETEISRNLKGLGAIEIANAVSLAGFETAIRFFETQPRREREPDRKSLIANRHLYNNNNIVALVHTTAVATFTTTTIS